MINCLKKTKSCSQFSDKGNHKRVSSTSKAIILNDIDFESEKSFLLDQSIWSTLTGELNLDPYSNIENIRSKNPKRLIIAKLNINSLRSKIDSSFSTSQFKIEGYATYRLDRNSSGRGILPYAEC